MEDEAKDISRRNAELVLYPEQLEKALEVLNSGWVKKWAWILHDKDTKTDGTPMEPHLHFEIQLHKPSKDSVISNKFDIRRNQIEKIKGTWADALDYLTHHNAPSKYQYDVSEVHANFDWEAEAQNSTSRQKARLEEIIEKIGTGEVREYNLHDYVSVGDYVRYQRKIKNAFEWRKGYVKENLEELVAMKTIAWVCGPAGVGKTTFAKKLAKTVNLVYTLTSTGSNMFDDYAGEPCVIVDDLRPEDFKFNDLLGLLDPYNFKPIQARYVNKVMQAQMIIVTTILTPEQFCDAVDNNGLYSEDKKQLYRRIDNVYEMNESEVIEYEYNEYLTGRDVTNRWANVWKIIKKREANKKKLSEAVDKLMMQELSLA